MIAFLLLSSLATAGERLEVRADPVVELFSVLARLAEYREFVEGVPDTPYARAVDAHFAPHAEHRAVGLTRRLRQRNGVGYNAHADLSLHVDEDLRLLVPLEPFPERLDERWRSAPTERYLEAVRDFREDTAFDTFWAGQQAYIEEVEARYEAYFGPHEVVTWFDELFGPMDGGRYLVRPGMLSGQHNYGSSARLADGALVFAPVLGVTSADIEASTTSLALVVHELGHGYVNPLFEAHPVALREGAEAAFAHTERQMRAQAYPTWEHLANESGVRAVTVLFALDHFGPEEACAWAAHDVGASFAWVPALVEALDAGRSPIESWPSVTGEQLAAWAAEPTWPYLGTINGAMRSFRGHTSFVLPERNDADPRAEAARSYAQGIRDRFFADAPLVASAATEGLTVFYGTPETNQGLAAELERLGWRVEADAVHLAGHVIEGEDLTLIALHDRVLLYASATSQGLVGINSVFHGPSDWLIARREGEGFVEVESGSFPKTLDGRWGQLAPEGVTDDALIQRPADEAALVDDMRAMKAAADAIIEEVLTAPGPAEQRYHDGVDRIMVAMPATFGPANAWLYSERAAKLGALCQGLELGPEHCDEVDESLRRD